MQRVTPKARLVVAPSERERLDARPGSFERKFSPPRRVHGAKSSRKASARKRQSRSLCLMRAWRVYAGALCERRIRSHTLRAMALPSLTA